MANNGSPCVVPAAHVVVEAGYRSQSTVGANGTSTLQTYPLALLRFGVARHLELVLQPPVFSQRGGAALGGTFVPAHGTQDSGAGIKWMLDDRPRFQDAVEAFFSVPTGTPLGSTGFSAAASTSTLTYTAAFTVGSLGISITQNAISNAAPLDPAGATRFFSYQPSLTLSYGFAPNFTLLVAEQLTVPLGPGSGTGNRALIAIQRVVSPSVVIDLDYEINALPLAPAIRQHAIGFGAAIAL